MVSPCVFIFVFLLRKRKVLKIYNRQSTYKKHKTKACEAPKERRHIRYSKIVLYVGHPKHLEHEDT